MARSMYTGRDESPGPLFDPPKLARADGPATSKAAAATAERAVVGETLEVLRALVSYQRSWGAAGTARQIARHETSDGAFVFVVQKRMSVLQDAGLATPRGLAADPETGRQAVTWEPTPAGEAAVGGAA